MQSLWLIFFSAAVILVIRATIIYLQVIRSIGNFPGLRVFFHRNSVISNHVLPPIPGISLGRNHLFRAKHSYFAATGWDIVSSVTISSNISASFILADAAVIKEVTSSRARFPKPVEIYKAVSIYGPNIVASEGDEWRKYRKIAAPVFSDRNNKLVWDETVTIMNGLFDDVWEGQDTITVDHCVDLTLPIALFVIGAAGFGRRLSWKDNAVTPANHKMQFKEALQIVSHKITVKVVTPQWAYLTKGLRKVDTAFKELGLYMSEMIEERQLLPGDGNDLLSSLLEANSGEPDEKWTETELMGNIFVFLLAGHETTAHTLAFTFALLALHQDEQEILYKHILSVIPSARTPTYTEMPLLTQSMAVFYETLRLFPPVTGIPKSSAEDTTLVVKNSRGESIRVPIPKGSELVIDTPGLHYNPRYWEDPHAFKPSRFLGDWPRDAFLPFSAGPRACIGRKFFETEGIAILTMLVSKYKIEIKEEPQYAGESFEAKRERILRANSIITLCPVRVPLVFKRRV